MDFKQATGKEHDKMRAESQLLKSDITELKAEHTELQIRVQILAAKMSNTSAYDAVESSCHAEPSSLPVIGNSFAYGLRLLKPQQQSHPLYDLTSLRLATECQDSNASESDCGY